MGCLSCYYLFGCCFGEILWKLTARNLTRASQGREMGLIILPLHHSHSIGIMSANYSGMNGICLLFPSL